jgi:hypothetical protein
VCKFLHTGQPRMGPFAKVRVSRLVFSDLAAYASSIEEPGLLISLYGEVQGGS